VKGGYDAVGSPWDEASSAQCARIVQEEVVYDGWIHLRRVMLQMPDGAVVERHIEDHGTSVTVLPYDIDRRCALLVSMPRAPVLAAGEADLLEAISGRLEESDPRHCAAHEAMEEAGVRLGQLEEVGFFWSMPSQSLERIRFFLAPYTKADRCGPGGGSAAEAENVKVHELALASLPGFIRDGRLRDLKTIVLVQMLQMLMPDFFEPGGASARG
jgi:nudix-type nucleoside diphosphatase (YffH/AdpP family)